VASLLPIYKEYGTTYHADTCEPVVRAVEAGQVRLEALVRGSYPGRKLARNELPGVRTLGFWDAEGKQDWGLEWHRNEGLELTFLESGSIDFGVQDERHRLQPDDLTITRPWQPHRVGDPHIGPCRLHWLILDVGVRRPNQSWSWPRWLVLTDADRRRLTEILRHNEQPVWHAGGDIRRCFQQLARAVEADAGGSSISRLAALLNELFVLLLEMFTQQSVELDASLSSTRRTVELFLDDLRGDREQLAQPWTLPQMADRCGLGPTQFVHLCKQLTNTTPAQYLTQCRIEAAADLLTARAELSILAVAVACGFSSSQYFATLFRKHMGVTPREYRKNGSH